MGETNDTVGTEFTFDLTSDGCLEMNMDSLTAWTLCSEFHLPTVQPTAQPTQDPLYLKHHTTIASDMFSTPSTTTNDGASDAATAIDALTSGDFSSVPILFYIIFLVLICVICFLCV